jgi:membrane protein YdbS with pleckstrin-like domain
MLDYSGSDYRPLDPRVLRLWQLTDLIAYVILLLVGVIGGVVLMVNLPASRTWVAAAWVAFALLGLWTILYYHPRNYRAWGYRLDQRVLLIRHGVWFRAVKLLPLTRLQHVDIKRGPLQRHFGLSTLVLHTAGTAAASIEVPGLDADEAVRLRDQLVAAGGDDGV